MTNNLLQHSRRRNPAPTLQALAATLLALACAAPSEPPPRPDAPPDAPNLIVILADDLGYSDIGAYGGEIDTPHLDQMAASGLRLVNFYNNAKCSESRAALLAGVYHHQTQNLKLPNHVTLAEVLRDHGYRTLMTGKWHVDGHPRERGFDRFFGFLVGTINFFTGESGGENRLQLDRERYEPGDDFYTTDAFTNFALDFIEEGRGEGRPFFLYLAHNAPHFPLHALPEDIEKYRGRFAAGWDELRARRDARMRSMGLLDASWPLTPRDPLVPAWDTLTPEQQAREQELMEVYAAMVDRLDQNIGRLMRYLEESGLAENTLTLFLSDNGGCPYANANRTPEASPGPADTFMTYDSEWANVSNTPFRLYKQWSHEGGIATPFIAHWPGEIMDGGQISRQVGHLVDLMPTLLDAAGATYPNELLGRDLLAREGVSLLPVLQGGDAFERDPLYWEFWGNRAVRDGRWKLVGERGKKWELYDMEVDRTELRDLTASDPERAARMAEMYERWAERTGAMTNQQSIEHGTSKQPRIRPLE